MGLFLSTLLIFVITPQVDYGDRGFPVLLLMGQFLLKDLALLAASVTVVAMATERATARQPVAATCSTAQKGRDCNRQQIR